MVIAIYCSCKNTGLLCYMAYSKFRIILTLHPFLQQISIYILLKIEIIKHKNITIIINMMIKKSNEITKPFLKWVGGKTQIINKLLDNYPTEMNNYHDIFLGGGSTLFALLSYVKNGKIKVKEKIYAYDINEILIETYKDVQSNPKELYKYMHKLFKTYSNCEKDGEVNRKPTSKNEAVTSKESYYYWIRSKFNKENRSIKKSAHFIFLNKTCFRGLFRTAKNGFNVPFGRYYDASVINKDTLLNFSELIKDVEFKCMGYDESLKTIKKGDFAYLDPPYAPEKITSFVGYSENGFSGEQHTKLFAMCDVLRKRKINFMMSNADVKLVTTAFPTKKYKIQTIECRRAIHSKNPGKKTNEVIIKSF